MLYANFPWLDVLLPLSTFRPSIGAVKRMQLRHDSLASPWDVLPIPFYYPGSALSATHPLFGFY